MIRVLIIVPASFNLFLTRKSKISFAFRYWYNDELYYPCNNFTCRFILLDDMLLLGAGCGWFLTVSSDPLFF